MSPEIGRRRPEGTAPRFASKEWSANAQIVGHEQLGFEVWPVAHADVLVHSLEAAAWNGPTAPAVAIAVAAPPTPSKPPKPRENPPSTPNTNGVVLHDSADGGTVIEIRSSDEANTATDASGAPGKVAPCGAQRERDFLQVPANGHQIHVRICPTSHTWVRDDHWPSCQAYRAHTAQGHLADCADRVGSPNGADPWLFRAHRLDVLTEAAGSKLHCGQPEPFSRPSAQHRRHFHELRAVVLQEAIYAG